MATTYTVRCLGGVAWTENIPDLMAAAREWMVSRDAGLAGTRIIDDTTGLDVTDAALAELDEHERDFRPDDEDEDPPCDACGRPPHGWPRCRCASDVDMQIADHEDGS